MKIALQICLLFSLCTVASCDKGGDVCGPGEICLADESTVVFGQFYGLCTGEECVEIFKIDENGLFEDTKDMYPDRISSYEGEFTPLEYSGSLDVDDFIPYLQFLNEQSEKVLGCPDCADQGGVIIQIEGQDSNGSFWIIDNNKDAVPEEVHGVIDLIHDTIEEING